LKEKYKISDLMGIYKKPKINPNIRLRPRNPSSDKYILNITRNKQGREVREKINLTLLQKVRKIKKEQALDKEIENLRKRQAEEFILRSAPNGMVRQLRGKGFLQKNERLMNVRKKALLDLGFRGEKLSKILYLFRLRKAATILANARGLATKETIIEFSEFIKKNKPKLIKLFSGNKSAIKMFASTFENSLKYVDSEQLGKIINNPLNSSLVEEVQKAQIALKPDLDPKRFSRLVPFNNYFTFFAMSDLVGRMIENEIGEKYESFKKIVGKERKRI